jgi:hypothetical protein
MVPTINSNLPGTALSNTSGIHCRLTHFIPARNYNGLFSDTTESARNKQKSSKPFEKPAYGDKSQLDPLFPLPAITQLAVNRGPLRRWCLSAP